MDATIQFIGVIESPLKKLEDCPLQENEDAPEATIKIYPQFSEAMKDLREGSEVLLFTWLHLADREVLVTRPRNNPAAALTGVFSTRSPDRPNPIGIHKAKIVSKLSNDAVKVSVLEVLDQTPLIDIKPVLQARNIS